MANFLSKLLSIKVYIIISFLGFVTAFAIMDSMIMPGVVKLDEVVQIPKLTGLDYETAGDICMLRGLEIFVESEIEDKNKPDNVILSQVPPEESVVKKGKTVSVVLNKLSSKIIVPKVKNETARIARLKLKQTGIDKINIMYMHSEVVKKGRVISTNPPAGTELRTRAVNILVSKGKVEDDPIEEIIPEEKFKDEKIEF